MAVKITVHVVAKFAHVQDFLRWSISRVIISSPNNLKRMTLTDNINEMIQLTCAENTRVESAFARLELSKGEFWIKEGKICKQIVFLQTGKLRVFYHDNSGNKITCYL
ncbi:hypothetical protein [Dyadobacter sp. LHD-138]|uniref:hypothetical protein n=1 Tax=Dyadobacter sp. LHD-138 TaxID=3071413 RepID=UPI0027DF1602|nr:hypothetical protein [Dyadobacter sp. LHD-138]MDQ6482025.1 hypothetical protein [Dyadobacter sp. LHD-138]